jgi:hypothetical protein
MSGISVIYPTGLDKCFFSMDGVLQATLCNINNLAQCNNPMSNIIQTDFWKYPLELTNCCTYIFPFLLYFDEFEIGDPLGSHAGLHKLGAVYYSIPVIPANQQSSLEHLFLALLFHSTDQKTVSNKLIFSKLIDELNYLDTEGITININGKEIKIYFKLTLIQGDNLGLHSLLGFTQSFNSNYFCRFCKTFRDDTYRQVTLDGRLIRNKENYEQDLLIKDISLTGIREYCIFNRVASFHVTNNLFVDIMHDLLEGVCIYDMSLILYYYIIETKQLDFDTVNYRITHFNFDFDCRNKPPPISYDHLQKKDQNDSLRNASFL